jgi:hypothetical protein
MAATPPAAKKELFDYIRTNVIGHDAIITTPYGERRLAYHDYTGRYTHINAWERGL